MIVIKFGGTSVGTAERMRQAIEIVAAAADRRPVVVVSALAGVTNQLLEAMRLASSGDGAAAQQRVDEIRTRHEEIAFTLVQQKSDYLDSFRKQLARHTDQISDVLRGICVVGEVSPRAQDRIVAIGEKLSSLLFSYTMRLKKLTGIHVDSEEVIVTDGRFGEASPLMAETTAAAECSLRPSIDRGHIPVMGGFFGRSTGGATTTLGRGGSDYSAAIVGAALGADEIQIWTDVDGMMTCDPRVVPQARVIDVISYVEAAELASFGAKVLHPKTIGPAVELDIPIRVLNTHNVESAGTLITRTGDEQRTGPRAIAVKKGATLIHLTSSQMLGAHGFLARIFNIFDELEVSVDLVATSEVSISVTVDDSAAADRLRAALEPHVGVEVEREQAIIALVGRSLLHDTSLLAGVFTALRGHQVAMLTLGCSELNLSIVVPAAEADGAVRAVHRELFERSGEEAA